tara:strand:+ start:27173 stop:28030 length:858 start_codon:yes stop_codon:yes gene_type:complete
MKSVITIGKPAVYFGDFLGTYPEYTLYSFNHTNAEFRVPIFSAAERYEDPLTGLDKYLATIADDLVCVISGGEVVSLICLQILEKLKNKNIEVIYLQPELDILNKTGIMVHNLVQGVLQEMTRSHVFKRFYFFDLALAKQVTPNAILSEVPKKVAEMCAQHYHTYSWLASQESVFGVNEDKIENATISSLSYCDFNLTNVTDLGILGFIREQEVFYGIPEKKLEEDTGLYDEVMKSFKSFKKEEIRTSFNVFSVPFDDEVVYIKNSTTAVQNKILKEALDKAREV